MQDKIIAAIADWIDENEGNLKACAIISDHKDEIAEEIYRAIAPLVEAGEPDWKDAPDWAEWMLKYSDEECSFSKGYPSYITTEVVKVERRTK